MYSFASVPSSVPVAHRGAQDVAGRVVGQAEVLLEALALGSLAGPGRAEKDEIQLGHVEDIQATSPDGDQRTQRLAGPRRQGRYFRKPS